MVRRLLRHVSPLAGGLTSRVSAQKGGLLMPSFVRPWLNNCGAHRCLVFFNAITERGYEALARLCDPSQCCGLDKISRHCILRRR